MTVPAKPVILVIIDGLTPSMLEDAIASGATPTLAALAARGHYGRAVSVFPSLTPVCLSSIATGAHGDVHEIPHLVWYHRGEQRLVEYGSSFGAVRAAGIGRTLRDTLVNMNAEHLGRRAVTLFEALSDAGLRTAAVNFTAYRGRTTHRSLLPLLGDVRGPEHFFFYNLFQSERTGAPLSSATAPQARSMPTPRRSRAGSSRATASTSSSSTSPTTTTPRTSSVPMQRTTRSAAATTPSVLLSGRPEASTSCWRGMPSW